MQTANNLIFNSTVAANGVWRNINNWVNLSLQINGLEGNVWVEVSNDPNVLIDGATIAAPAAPVLSQYTPTVDEHLAGVAVNTTYYVKNTYVTAPALPSTLTVSGETVGSTESSLLVTAGNLLVVHSPAPDTGGYASGWNCYISTTSGTEVRQNLIDNAYPQALSFGRLFTPSAIINSGIAVPSSNTTATPNSGVNITGNLVGLGSTPAYSTQVQIVVSGTQAMINPSGVVWNFIRVNKSGGGSVLTAAYLFGQLG